MIWRLLIAVIGLAAAVRAEAAIIGGGMLRPSSAAILACPFGSSSVDGCGVSPGLYYAPAVNNTTRPTAAQWSAYARQSGQSWANNHPQSWNGAAVDYGIGPNSAIGSLPSIDTWPAGQNGCTYFRIGGAALPFHAQSNGWPHDASNAVLLNVLDCEGNSGASYAIQNYAFTDSVNGECAAIFLNDQTHNTPGTVIVTIKGNSFKNSARCVGNCAPSSAAQTWAPPSGPTPGVCSAAGSSLLGYITVQDGTWAKIVAWNNYVDDRSDQSCCYVKKYSHTFMSGKMSGDLSARFNYFYHPMHNPFSMSWVGGGETATACANGQTNAMLGGSWPYPGYNIDISDNYVEGIGHFVGYGHGEIMNHGSSLAASQILTDSSGVGALTNPGGGVGVLTSSLNTIPLGAMVFDAGGIAQGGVFVLSAPSGSGPYTYNVTNQSNVTFSGQTIKAFTMHICQDHFAYNTLLAPGLTSGGGMTTWFQGMNSDLSYTVPAANIEWFDVDHNTIGTNVIAGATAKGTPVGATVTQQYFNIQSVAAGADASCASLTPFSSGNCVIILGLGASATNPRTGASIGPTTGGTCLGDANQVAYGPYVGMYTVGGASVFGLNGQAYCNGSDQAVYWVGCGSPDGPPCPVVLMDTTPATVFNSGSPVNNLAFTYGVVNATITEWGHTQVNNMTVTNNYADITGAQTGAFIVANGGRVYCQSTVVSSGNVGLIDGASLNTVANSPSTGC